MTVLKVLPLPEALKEMPCGDICGFLTAHLPRQFPPGKTEFMFPSMDIGNFVVTFHETNGIYHVSFDIVDSSPVKTCLRTFGLLIYRILMGESMNESGALDLEALCNYISKFNIKPVVWQYTQGLFRDCMDVYSPRPTTSSLLKR